MDAFEENVLNNKIGAPVTEYILNKFIIPLFTNVYNHSLSKNDNKKVLIKKIMDQIGINENDLYTINNTNNKPITHPNLIIISTSGSTKVN